MITCAIYPRKSKADENSESMETQIAMCKEYISKNFKNAKILLYDNDYGITGHSIEKRHDFKRMMNDVRSGLINVVIVQRYDRLARNIRDFCNVYHDMEQVGCNLVSVSQNIDTTTPYGKNFMYQQASMAELEWALCSERHKDVNRYAMLQGKCNLSPYSIPVGYKAERIDGVRRMVKDKKTEPIIEFMIDGIKSGIARSRIVSVVNGKFGTKYSNSLWQTFARSTFYFGEYRECKNYCEPYLTKEEWEKLTAKTESKVRYHDDEGKNMLFTGLIRCPSCGNTMEPQVVRNKGYENYHYYRCTKHARERLCQFKWNINERMVESYLLENVELKLEKEILSVKPIDYSMPKINKDECEKELKRLNIMFQKGRIQETEYDKEYERISNLLMESQEQPKELNYDSIKEALSNDWKEIYNSLTKSNKKRFWRGIIQEIKINENKEFNDIIFLK